MAICTSLVLFWLVSCARVPSTATATLTPRPSPALTWDANPSARIVLATSCCDGPVIEELVRPYIPEAQVGGNGRILWSEQEDRVRQVFVTQLSTTEMRDLLQEIAASGFFDWDEEYKGEPVVDATSKCLTITLTEQSKKVCETHGGAPDAFYTLFDWLSLGAGNNGSLYRPEIAYVTGFQLDDAAVASFEPDLAWPQTLAHIPVAEILDGFWLDESEALQLLWEATNANLHHMPVVADGDDRYRIILQIPGVSWIGP